MMTANCPAEVLNADIHDGTMPANVEQLALAVVGRRIVSAKQVRDPDHPDSTDGVFVLRLDDGSIVRMADTVDCCAGTWLSSFLLEPGAVDHVITGVGITEDYKVWHVYADYGDVLKLMVDWICGNPFYYGLGFDIQVVPHGFVEDVSEVKSRTRGD